MELNCFPFRNIPMTERFIPFRSIFFCVCVCVLLQGLWRRVGGSRRVFALVSDSFAIFFFFTRTLGQNVRSYCVVVASSSAPFAFAPSVISFVALVGLGWVCFVSFRLLFADLGPFRFSRALIGRFCRSRASTEHFCWRWWWRSTTRLAFVDIDVGFPFAPMKRWCSCWKKNINFFFLKRRNHVWWRLVSREHFCKLDIIERRISILAVNLLRYVSSDFSFDLFRSRNE